MFRFSNILNKPSLNLILRQVTRIELKLYLVTVFNDVQCRNKRFLSYVLCLCLCFSQSGYSWQQTVVCRSVCDHFDMFDPMCTGEIWLFTWPRIFSILPGVKRYWVKLEGKQVAATVPASDRRDVTAGFPLGMSELDGTCILRGCSWQKAGKYRSPHAAQQAKVQYKDNKDLYRQDVCSVAGTQYEMAAGEDWYKGLEAKE